MAIVHWPRIDTPGHPSERIWWARFPFTWRFLLVCGILSSALYLAADVFAWSQYPGYSPVSHAFSELLAEGAPTRPFMVAVAGAPYNLLVAALGLGVWALPGRARVSRITGALLVLYADDLAAVRTVLRRHRVDTWAETGTSLHFRDCCGNVLVATVTP